MGDFFSPFHLIIVLLVALLVFGPKRLPEIGQGLGRSIQEFRNAMNTGAQTAGTGGPGMQAQSMVTERPAPVAAPYGTPAAEADPLEVVDVPASSIRRHPS